MVRIAVIVLSLLLLSGCGRATPEGYWEGKGRTSEVPLKDRFRQLTRKADFEFWFTADRAGNAVGEIELVYDAELKVENLPSVSMGMFSFNPSVGGRVTDLNPKRRFPLVGVLALEGEQGQLALEIATPEDTRPKIEFTMRADPGVSAGLGGGLVTIPGGAAGVGEVTVRRIDMKPFSPFGGPAKVEKRPGGPFAARYEDRAEKYSIEWSARQAGGEQRRVERTRDMDDLIRKLRDQLNRR